MTVQRAELSCVYEERMETVRAEYEEINRRILEMKEEILEAIRESIAIRSMKSDPLPGAPYGEGP